MAEPALRWMLEYRARPFTTNLIYGRWNRHQRNQANQEWREAFAWLAREQKIPKLDAIKVLAWPVLSDRRVQDVGACAPAVKAAIDGLVDAGVVPDDDPRYVTFIGFGPPELDQPFDALRMVVMTDDHEAHWVVRH